MIKVTEMVGIGCWRRVKEQQRSSVFDVFSCNWLYNVDFLYDETNAFLPEKMTTFGNKNVSASTCVVPYKLTSPMFYLVR